MTKERKIVLIFVSTFIFLFAFVYPGFFFFPHAKVNPNTVERIMLVTDWADVQVEVTDPEDIEVLLNGIEETKRTGVMMGAASGGCNLQYYRFYLRNGETLDFTYDIEEQVSENLWRMSTLEPHPLITFEGDLPRIFEELYEKNLAYESFSLDSGI